METFSITPTFEEEVVLSGSIVFLVVVVVVVEVVFGGGGGAALTGSLTLTRPRATDSLVPSEAKT